MKLRIIGLSMAIAMLFAVAALPASAALPGTHAGVFSATADVGKYGSCNEQGEGTATGGGIGLLPVRLEGDPPIPVTEVKNAWFTISGGVVVDAVSGLGTANLCGRLTAPLHDTTVPCLPPDPDDPTCIEPLDAKHIELTDEVAVGIGASCATTKGWGGYGKAVLGTPPTVKPEVVYISNLGWKVTVGGTFTVTGNTGAGKMSDGADHDGLLVAVVQALNENIVLSCIDKVSTGNKDEPHPFTVAAAYVITPAGGAANPEKDPKKPKDD